MANVQELRAKPRDWQEDYGQELRHLALQVAAMLPSDHGQAIKVLTIAREVVDEFLST